MGNETSNSTGYNFTDDLNMNMNINTITHLFYNDENCMVSYDNGMCMMTTFEFWQFLILLIMFIEINIIMIIVCIKNQYLGYSMLC